MLNLWNSLNTMTARDVYSRPSYSMLRARAYYSSYIATIFIVVLQGTSVDRYRITGPYRSGQSVKKENKFIQIC